MDERTNKFARRKLPYFTFINSKIPGYGGGGYGGGGYGGGGYGIWPSHVILKLYAVDICDSFTDEPKIVIAILFVWRFYSLKLRLYYLFIVIYGNLLKLCPFSARRNVLKLYFFYQGGGGYGGGGYGGGGSGGGGYGGGRFFTNNLRPDIQKMYR